MNLSIRQENFSHQWADDSTAQQAYFKALEKNGDEFEAERFAGEVEYLSVSIPYLLGLADKVHTQHRGHGLSKDKTDDLIKFFETRHWFWRYPQQ